MASSPAVGDSSSAGSRSSRRHGKCAGRAPADAMDSYQTRRSGTLRSLAQYANCPICGRMFSSELIQEHADACATRLEKRNSALVAARPPGTAPKPRRKPPPRSRTPIRGRGRPRPEISSPRRFAGSIETDMIDGFEFRCQGGRSPGRVTLRLAEEQTNGAASSSSSRQPEVKGSSSNSTVPRELQPVGPIEPTPKASSKRPLPLLSDSSQKRSKPFLAPPAPPRRPEPHPSLSVNAPAAAVVDFSEQDNGEAFLMRVREAFVHQPRILDQFMDVMAAFEDGLLDTVEVMQHTAVLLKGHKQLLRQFNSFLPNDYRIEWLPPSLTNYQSFHGTSTLPSHQRAQQLAASFVDRLVERFADRPSTLAAIAHALGSQKLEDPTKETNPRLKPPASAMRVLEDVQPLLCDEPDLLEEFLQYVPVNAFHDGHVMVAT